MRPDERAERHRNSARSPGSCASFPAESYVGSRDCYGSLARGRYVSVTNE